MESWLQRTIEVTCLTSPQGEQESLVHETVEGKTQGVM